MVSGSEITSLLTGKDSLILFFGIYLTTLINLIRKYRTFDVHLLLSKDKIKRVHSIRRFLAGFFIIDVFPVTWFLVLYQFIIPSGGGPFPIMAAAFASLSILGFARILHSIVATGNHHKFYSSEEFGYVISKWGKGDDDDNTFKAHFITGICYLILFPSIAYIIGRIAF
jgi:hypothetical protein